MTHTEISPAIHGIFTEHAALLSQDATERMWRQGFDADPKALFGFISAEYERKANASPRLPTNIAMYHYLREGIQSGLLSEPEIMSVSKVFTEFDDRLALFDILPTGDFRDQVQDELLLKDPHDPFADRVVKAQWAVFRQITPDIRSAIEKARDYHKPGEWRSNFFAIDAIVYLLDQTRGTDKHVEVVEIARDFFQARGDIFDNWKEYSENLPFLFVDLPEIFDDSSVFLNEVTKEMVRMHKLEKLEFAEDKLIKHDRVNVGLFAYSVRKKDMENAYDAMMRTQTAWSVVEGLSNIYPYISIETDTHEEEWNLIREIIKNYPMSKKPDPLFMNRLAVTAWLGATTEAYENGVDVSEWSIPDDLLIDMSGNIWDEGWDNHIETATQSPKVFEILDIRMNKLLTKLQNKGRAGDQEIVLAYALLASQRLKFH